MKTVEELAKEIFMKAGLVKMSEMEGVVATLIRADREEVLRRVEEAFIDSPSFTGGGKLTVCESGILADFSESIAAVKKEVCG